MWQCTLYVRYVQFFQQFDILKSFGTQFISLTTNKCAYKAVLRVYKTLQVYRVEIPCRASTRCLVGTPLHT